MTAYSNSTEGIILYGIIRHVWQLNSQQEIAQITTWDPNPRAKIIYQFSFGSGILVKVSVVQLLISSFLICLDYEWIFRESVASKMRFC